MMWESCHQIRNERLRLASVVDFVRNPPTHTIGKCRNVCGSLNPPKIFSFDTSVTSWIDCVYRDRPPASNHFVQYQLSWPCPASSKYKKKIELAPVPLVLPRTQNFFSTFRFIWHSSAECTVDIICSARTDKMMMMMRPCIIRIRVDIPMASRLPGRWWNGVVISTSARVFSWSGWRRWVLTLSSPCY